MRTLSRKLLWVSKLISRRHPDSEFPASGVPNDLAIEIDHNDSPISKTPAKWLVCFVPGLKKQWWHRFRLARVRFFFAFMRPLLRRDLAGSPPSVRSTCGTEQLEPTASDPQFYTIAVSFIRHIGRRYQRAHGHISTISREQRKPSVGWITIYRQVRRRCRTSDHASSLVI